MGVEIVNIGVIAFLPLLFGACATVAIPEHKVMEKRDGYEIREYRKYLVAETEVLGPYKDSLNKGFRILFDFIRGNNERKEPVEMTAPVLQESSTAPEKIEMTAPVLQENREGGNVIAFIMPAKFSLQTLPRPNDPRIRIREVEKRKVAVRRYTWYATEDRVQRETARLEGMLARDNVQPLSVYRSAQYNPPWTPPFLRRNEIWVDVK